MPLWQLKMFATMLPRLEAQELINAAQVSMLPHYSGSRQNKNEGNQIRQRVIGAWRRMAHGRDDDVNVLHGAAQVKGWFNSIRWGRPVQPV